MLNIENEQEKLEITPEIEEKLKDALETVTSGEGVEYDSVVDLIFTDDEGIKRINESERNIDAPTDVLSFPLLEYPAGKVYSEVYSDENLKDHMFLNDSLMLGDVVISGERAVSQAGEYGHSIMRETVFLFVHSLLHLLGYDHMNEEDRKKMNEREDRYMTLLDLER